MTMTTEHVASQPGREQRALNPYAPSWVDRMDDWFGTLPVPRWLIYLTLMATLVLVNTLFKWWDGVYPFGAFLPFHVVVTAYTAWYFALVSYLDHIALQAIERFRPAFRGDTANYETFKYRLTTMPALPTLLVSMAGALWGTMIVAGASQGIFLSDATMILRSPSSLWFEYFIAITVNIGLFIFVYHAVHQLRVVNTIHTSHTNVDLFQPGPLRAFSWLTAQIAACGILTAYVWFLSESDLTGNVVSVSVFVTLNILGVVTFIAPLFGIHRMLENEKATALCRASERLHIVLSDLHSHIDKRSYTELDPVNKAIVGIKEEIALLEKVATWPWKPETVRLLITAILLPIVLWLVIRALERLLNW
jgi:hypothetical protein